MAKHPPRNTLDRHLADMRSELVRILEGLESARAAVMSWFEPAQWRADIAKDNERIRELAFTENGEVINPNIEEAVAWIGEYNGIEGILDELQEDSGKLLKEQIALVRSKLEELDAVIEATPPGSFFQTVTDDE